MKRTNLLRLLIVALLFVGCEEKKPDSQPLMIENTTEIFTEKDKQIQEEKKSTKKVQKESKSIEKSLLADDQFIIKNPKSQQHLLTLSSKQIAIENIQKPVVLLQILPSLAPEQRSQLSTLATLHKKYKDDLFITSVSSNESTQRSEELGKNVKFFTSFGADNEKLTSKAYELFHIDPNKPSPLCIIYKKGVYYSHFEGAVPVEMLIHDIKNAIEN